MNPRGRRVVITGMGVVSAAGCDLPSFWQRLVSGPSATRRIERFDVSAFPSQVGGEIRVQDLSALDSLPDEWAHRGRIAHYAGVAARQAIRDADVLNSIEPGRQVGVSIAAGMGGFDHDEVVGSTAAAWSLPDGAFDGPRFAAALRGRLKPRAIERRNPGAIPAAIARQYGLAGPVLCVMTACAGGTQAIGDALRWIRAGTVDVAVAGGTDSELSPLGLASFCLLGALTRRNDDPERASRPFDVSRDGFVLGEGAGALVLEERERALNRGARVYAEVAGFGSACDAYRATDPHPEGTGAVLAMRRALDHAGISPSDIGYINAHGTSTVANDRIETLAIRRLFGWHAQRLLISSTKSIIGHATVAAGAIEAIATALVLHHQVAHPTFNLDAADPACDLDYVPNQSRAIACEAALSNSFASGGQSACLAFARHRV